MRIIHVITGMQKAAGTTTFVENVVREQRALGHEVEICTIEVKVRGEGEQWWGTKFYDVVHIHGLWSPLLHKAARYARRSKIPVVWSTHGMTAPWSLRHKWWKKWLPWYLFQLPDLKSAALIHCTTELEAEWNRALGFGNVFVAPLGTNLPAIDATTKDALDGDCGGLGTARPTDARTLLYVGRIYPVKALDNAIRAVALFLKSIRDTRHETRDRQAPLRLRLVGPDQAGHMGELMALCDQLGLKYSKPGEENSAEVQFVGPKYDEELSAEYDNCDGLILVSHTENFGATVVDAMAHGKPVITSTKTPWKVVADNYCGWWVDNSSESLAKAFGEFASTSTSDLNLMGRNGRALVEREYTWPAVARNLVDQYERVMD